VDVELLTGINFEELVCLYIPRDFFFLFVFGWNNSLCWFRSSQSPDNGILSTKEFTNWQTMKPSILLKRVQKKLFLGQDSAYLSTILVIFFCILLIAAMFESAPMRLLPRGFIWFLSIDSSTADPYQLHHLRSTSVNTYEINWTETSIYATNNRNPNKFLMRQKNWEITTQIMQKDPLFWN
jgi:hypothetical protein